MLLSDPAGGISHRRPYGDHEVVACSGKLREIGDVVGDAERLEDLALDFEVEDCSLEALESSRVEALIVQTIRVGDDANGDLSCELKPRLRERLSG